MPKKSIAPKTVVHPPLPVLEKLFQRNGYVREQNSYLKQKLGAKYKKVGKSALFSRRRENWHRFTNCSMMQVSSPAIILQNTTVSSSLFTANKRLTTFVEFGVSGSRSPAPTYYLLPTTYFPIFLAQPARAW